MTGSIPKLAVIVNCYNYAVYVERAIRSVLMQGRDDFELIVVDDGSTDDSWEIISKTGAKAYRVANGGQRRACLFGVDRTTAPFVLFLDADDELAPGALDAIIPRLEPSIAKLQFCLSRVDGDGSRLGSAVPEPDLMCVSSDLGERVRRTGVYVSPPTSGNVFRRDLCELLRDADYDDAVDGIILLAAPFFGQVVSIPQELGLYRVHGRNMSGVGGAVDVDRIQQHMVRFQNLVAHLNRVMPTSSKLPLLDVERTFFYLEKKSVLASIERRADRFRQLPRLLKAISTDYFFPQRKLALSLFHVLIVVLPRDLALRLIELRFRPEQRTAVTWVRALTGSRR